MKTFLFSLPIFLSCSNKWLFLHAGWPAALKIQVKKNLINFPKALIVPFISRQ